MKITINWLREKNACVEGVSWFRNQKETDLIKICKTLIKTKDFKKLDWVNWVLCKVLNRKQKIKYAVFAAELVLPLFVKKYPDDSGPQEAIAAAKGVIKRDCKKNRDATYAAYAAARAAYAAADATAAAHAADVARHAVTAAATANAATATYAAYATTHDAAYAANAATGAKEKIKTMIKIVKYGLRLLEEK